MVNNLLNTSQAAARKKNPKQNARKVFKQQLGQQEAAQEGDCEEKHSLKSSVILVLEMRFFCMHIDLEVQTTYL